jgi:hypothetical protein
MILIYQFKSIREAIKNLKTSPVVFYKSLDTDIKYKNKWIISSTPLNS